ncbi:LysM peptidoglycan-binding domain-containing protein [uncultured Bifidobacterium sp.]|uniref:LysM peptidoglycan-binding domain-containing protein n=1 Tax=uncultured Bifidobacterium sp. TaxID=165187 RepID=UPI0028DC59A6|nr:LysM peptidoglycan-binding domain-containing protein [uncultured Bifidobacterium sp.]
MAMSQSASPTPKRERATLTRRGRVVTVLLAFALSCGAVGGFAAVRAQSATGPVETSTEVVQQGDTLWTYAEGITPRGDDVSVTVDRLMALNNLDSATLHPGQRIVVPVDSSQW